MTEDHLAFYIKVVSAHPGFCQQREVNAAGLGIINAIDEVYGRLDNITVSELLAQMEKIRQDIFKYLLM